MKPNPMLQHFSFLFFFLLFIAFTNSALAQNATASQEPAKKNIIDNGFYKYERTGDAKIDAENESRAKDEFVRNHPEQYQQMLESMSEKEKHAIDYNEYLKMPAAKKEHIDQNPDKYYFINK